MRSKAKLGLVLTALLFLAWAFTHEPQVQTTLHIPQMQERTKATMEEKRENKALAISFLNALGYNDSQIKCAVTLWTRESRFDHLARPRNSQGKPVSSAFGIAQLLRERSGAPELQVLHAVRYVEHRYRGSFCSAKRHSDRVGWY